MVSDTARVCAAISELENAALLLSCGVEQLHGPLWKYGGRFVPVLVLAQGIERLLKVLICLIERHRCGAFPAKRDWPHTHTLTALHSRAAAFIDSDCLPSESPGTGFHGDFDFAAHDADLVSLLDVLGVFNDKGRYHDLDTVLGTASADTDWAARLNAMEWAFVTLDPRWQELSHDPHRIAARQSAFAVHLTYLVQRFVRAVGRLCARGHLGPEGKSNAVRLLKWAMLNDERLRAPVQILAESE